MHGMCFRSEFSFNHYKHACFEHTWDVFIRAVNKLGTIECFKVFVVDKETAFFTHIKKQTVKDASSTSAQK